MQKVVRVFKSGAANTFLNVTTGDVFKGLQTASNFRVLDVKAWNHTPFGRNTNFIKLVSLNALLTNDGDSSTIFCLDGADVGSANSLAGVHMSVPDLLAANLSAVVSGTTGFVSIIGDPQETAGTNNDVQTYVVDIMVRFQPV